MIPVALPSSLRERNKAARRSRVLAAARAGDRGLAADVAPRSATVGLLLPTYRRGRLVPRPAEVFVQVTTRLALAPILTAILTLASQRPLLEYLDMRSYALLVVATATATTTANTPITVRTRRPGERSGHCHSARYAADRPCGDRMGISPDRCARGAAGRCGRRAPRRRAPPGRDARRPDAGGRHQDGGRSCDRRSRRARPRAACDRPAPDKPVMTRMSVMSWAARPDLAPSQPRC